MVNDEDYVKNRALVPFSSNIVNFILMDDDVS